MCAQKTKMQNANIFSMLKFSDELQSAMSVAWSIYIATNRNGEEGSR